MQWNNQNYYLAYDANYRTAYEADPGLKQANNSSHDVLLELLKKTGFNPQQTTLLDLGCGDGAMGLLLSRLGYRYIGIDVSEAAIQKARERARIAGIQIDLRVGDVLNPGQFPQGKFRILLDSYCFHMLVLDTHRKAYLESVKRILSDDGFFILLAQRDESVINAEINSFKEFCKLTGTNPEGVPYQKKQGDKWVEVEGKKCYLMGRANSLKGYHQELAKAGLAIVHEHLWENDHKAAFLLKKTGGLQTAG